jgi:cell division septal protein FtsQ
MGETIIVKLITLFRVALKKKSGNSYLDEDLRRCNVPGGKQSFHCDKNARLLRLRQWLVLRRRKNVDSYAGRKKQGKFLVWLGWLLFSCCCLVLFIVAGGGERLQHRLQSLAIFKVNEVIFSGCSIVSQGKLQDTAAIILHQTSLVGLDSAKIEERIGAVDWVSDVKITRNWPSTVEISVKENVPVALLHANGAKETEQLYYIDRKGKVFLSVKLGADIDFPIITGWSDIKNTEIKDRAFSEVLIFLRKLRINNPHLPVQSVSEIHVNQSGEMVVYLVEYPFPIFFGNGNTKIKYARLVQVLKALYKKKKGKELISRVQYIQMDYLNDKVLVAQSGSG